MKAKKQLIILLLFSILTSFISCDKEDKIDINQLVGRWSVYNDNPNFSIDGSIEYTFKEDNTCSIYSYDALSHRDTTVVRTYIISNDNKMITIYDTEKVYNKQYHIRKLTSKEMKWENASSFDSSYFEINFRKTNE